MTTRTKLLDLEGWTLLPLGLTPTGKQWTLDVTSNPEQIKMGYFVKDSQDLSSWLATATKVRIYITNGSVAETIIFTARTSKEKGPAGISAFIVEKGTPGFRVGKKESKMGLRASDTVELQFEDCLNVLGHGQTAEYRCLLRQVGQAQLGATVDRHVREARVVQIELARLEAFSDLAVQPELVSIGV